MGHVCELQRDLNLAREQLAQAGREAAEKIAALEAQLTEKDVEIDELVQKVRDLEAQLATVGKPWQEGIAKVVKDLFDDIRGRAEWKWMLDEGGPHGITHETLAEIKATWAAIIKQCLFCPEAAPVEQPERRCENCRNFHRKTDTGGRCWKNPPQLLSDEDNWTDPYVENEDRRGCFEPKNI